MKILVNSKNEYPFYPDVEDNLKKDVKERFTIVVRKVNQALASSDWFKYDKDNNYIGINNSSKLRSHILRIENAPTLEIDGGQKRELTIDDILSDTFAELYQITMDLNSFILKLCKTGEKETKKL